MNIDKDPSGAVFTDDRLHRLYLWRWWDSEKRWVMFIGLNPSTADELRDDPTIRRCIGFAKKWDFGGMFMCNVFTLVSTNPNKLNVESPIAMGTSLAMKVIRERCWMAIVAWGDLVTKVRSSEDRIERIKYQLSPLHCFGLTKKGNPRHPLYMPYSRELEIYSE